MTMTTPKNPNLTLQDRLDIEAAQSYLKAHAHLDNFQHLPEQSLAGVFNQLSPAARAHLQQQQAAVNDFRESGGRTAPFEPKRYLEDLALPEHTLRTIAKADTEDLTYRLNSRMGTPTASSTASEAPSMRDHIELAFTEHEGSDHD